jgi:hypothetical protein
MRGSTDAWQLSLIGYPDNQPNAASFVGAPQGKRSGYRLVRWGLVLRAIVDGR